MQSPDYFELCKRLATTHYLSALGTAVEAHPRHDLARAAGRRITSRWPTIQQPVQLQSTVPRFVSHLATRRDSTTAPPLTAYPVRKIRGISMARISGQPFNVAPQRGPRARHESHGPYWKEVVWESANCWPRCSSFVAACARPWLPPQAPMTVRSPIPSRWSRLQTRPPGLLQSTTFTSQKVFSAPPGRPTASKSFSPVTLLAAPICGKCAPPADGRFN